MSFTGRIAIVTGGGSGIGRALCAELARRGATVVVADRSRERAEEAAGQIAEQGGRATSAVVDVAAEDQVKRLVEAAVARHGRLDLMVNNAGTAIGGNARDLTDAQWEDVFAVNWGGVLHGTRTAYERMTRQGYGHIVNVSSLAGLLPQPFNAPYCASKHAVVGLSLALRYEGADLGVKVSVVCQGYVRTGIATASEMVNVSDENRRRIRYPEGISPEEAALHILDGVEANREIIVFPARGRWIWRLYRFLPALIRPLLLRRLREFRRLRDETLRSSTPAGRETPRAQA
jgi:NAD(P)-dependent dehydrogenase (short-subunit alcohol dehydrogenase family)